MATVPVHYASEDLCSAAAPDALLDNSDLDFPTLVAECRPVAPLKSASDDRPKQDSAEARRS
ncbi:MAG: hypothetical protein ABIW03_03360 [Sphingomicrobium sp.]